MEYFYHYRACAYRAAERAKENAAIYGEQGLTYEMRKNALIYHLYSDRSIQAFAYREMYNYYLNYDFSGILVLFLCLYGLDSFVQLRGFTSLGCGFRFWIMRALYFRSERPRGEIFLCTPSAASARPGLTAVCGNTPFSPQSQGLWAYGL